jgi:PBSX family phage terminase large subunit
MDARTFRRRYDGLFEKMEGLVYDDLGTADIIEPKKLNFKEVIAGVDWGFNHPAAIAIIGIANDNEYYLIDEYYKSGKTTSEIIEKCNYFKDIYKVRFWYPDPAEPDRLEEMKRAGLHPREVNKNKGSIVKGIDCVRNLIRQNRFKIFNTCIYTQEEFSLYAYPEEGETKDEEPIKENDHLMDAIRYAVYTYQPLKIDMPIINQPDKPAPWR